MHMQIVNIQKSQKQQTKPSIHGSRKRIFTLGRAKPTARWFSQRHPLFTEYEIISSRNFIKTKNFYNHKFPTTRTRPVVIA